MMHGDPKYNGHVMCSYSLTEMSDYAMLMGLLPGKGACWNFRELGLPATGRSIKALVEVMKTLNPFWEVRSVSQDPHQHLRHVLRMSGKCVAVELANR